MLVLARKPGESIVIGEGIEICIIESNNGIVKLGITAPKDIKVFRKELITEVKNENIDSTKNVELILKKIK
jgi:carbon storage regulator